MQRSGNPNILLCTTVFFRKAILPTGRYLLMGRKPVFLRMIDHDMSWLLLQEEVSCQTEHSGANNTWVPRPRNLHTRHLGCFLSVSSRVETLTCLAHHVCELNLRIHNSHIKIMSARSSVISVGSPRLTTTLSSANHADNRQTCIFYGTMRIPSLGSTR